ncbi:MAG: hypothetical protein IKB64_07500 [Paludibacteraceae bacterium]|nr:hypothetical protein [Paludibacteraceae bacterium]
MWQTPKTDWVATDPISVTDYNRIIGNLNELQTLCQRMYELTATDLGNTQTDSDYPYEDMLNAIETALANVNSASYDFDIGTGVVFVANGSYFDFTELNRIESASLRLYNWLSAQFENIPKLSFTLGLYRGLQV